MYIALYIDECVQEQLQLYFAIGAWVCIYIYVYIYIYIYICLHKRMACAKIMCAILIIMYQVAFELYTIRIEHCN